MGGNLPLLLGCVASASGSVMLRLAWSRAKRSVPRNALGWGLFGVGAVLGWISDGAWGTAVTSLFGMGAALVFLAQAAISTPSRTAPRPSNRGVGALPEAGQPLHLGRRVMTFLITVLAAWIVSIGLATAARSLAAIAGAGEANANVISFFVTPIAWTILGFGLLMETRRVRQWRLLGLCAIPGVVAMITGFVA